MTFKFLHLTLLNLVFLLSSVIGKSQENSSNNQNEDFDSNFTLSTESPEKTKTKIDSLRNIINNPDYSKKIRLKAYNNLILKSLYKDTRSSKDDLFNYLILAERYRDSFPVAFTQANNFIGFYYQKLEKLDSARFYYLRSYDFTLKKGITKSHLNTRINLALLEEKKGNYLDALDAYLDIIDSCEYHKKRNPEARARINAGLIYTLQSDYINAIQQLERALDLCVKNKLVGYRASANLYLGDVYTAIGEFKTAENYYKEALDWSDKMNNSNTKRLGIIQYIILKEKKADFQGALELAYKLLDFEDLLKVSNLKAESLTLIAQVFKQYGQQDSALHYVQMALDIYENAASKEKLYRTLNLAGKLHLEQGNFSKAFNYCNSSYQLNSNKADEEIHRENCLCLYKIYKQKGDPVNALKYHEEFISSSDRLFDREKAKEIVKIQLNNEFENEKYLDSLENALELSMIEEQNRQKIQKQLFINRSLIFGLIFSFCVALVLWYAFRVNKRQKEELERLNTLNKQIFSIISHDFKGPLMSMNLMLETLGNADINEKKLSYYLSDLKNQISQTSNILDNLLNWAKSELQINLSEHYKTALKPLSDEMSDFFNQKLKEKNLELISDVSENIVLDIHPDLLRIVLRNLLSNAIKFSYDGSSVHLGFDEKTNRIIVEDKGMGMSEEQQQELLKKPVFSEMGTNYESGFGIGLYITSELLKRIGWDINFLSEKNKGTTFFISSRRIK